MPHITPIHEAVMHGLFNEAYKQMDFLAANLESENLQRRAANIATTIDALHHDFAHYNDLTVQGS